LPNFISIKKEKEPRIANPRLHFREKKKDAHITSSACAELMLWLVGVLLISEKLRLYIG